MKKKYPLPQNKMHYLSLQVNEEKQFVDGCAGQYQGRKGFLHLTRLGIPVQRFFFGTSHGKSPCDGLGGIIKRMVARAILRGDVTIESAHDFYKYCQEFLTTIVSTRACRFS